MRKKQLLFVMFSLIFCFMSISCGKQEAKIQIEQPESAAEDREAAEQEEDTGDHIWVDVCGAVNQPGVYELDRNSRVFAAVEAAGGFAQNADRQWLNQAAFLSDGEKIQVYTLEETSAMREQGIEAGTDASDPEADSEGKSKNQKVNLNTASLEQLQEIPGIGQVRAQAILDYREQKGKFESIEDIQNISGIKGKTFDKIKDYITVE